MEVQSERLTDMQTLFESIPDVVTEYFSMKFSGKQEFIRDGWRTGTLVSV